MSIFKNRTVGFYLAFVSACLAVVGLICYAIALVDAGTTTNELIPWVFTPVIAAVFVEILCLWKPNLAGLRAVVPVGYCLGFSSIIYSVVFYIVNVSAKMYAYLSPAKVAALVCLGIAALCACVSVFMKESK